MRDDDGFLFSEVIRIAGKQPATHSQVQARNFSPGQLDAIYHHLLDTDLAIKTGEMEPRLALEMLVSTLTGVWLYDSSENNLLKPG